MNMLNASNLPEYYYTEAMKTAVYIYNRVKHHNQQKSPMELLLGTKPNYSKLQKFGCVCTAFVPKEKRDNDPVERGIMCRFLGYTDDFDDVEYSGYILVNESTGEIIFSDSRAFQSWKIFHFFFLNKPFLLWHQK
jgi:hypothetical protein